MDTTADLLELLCALDGVRQDPRYHPEGDALFHSLQVFECARRATSDVTLWAAALFHDVGKAVSSPDHDAVGADLLEGLLAPRVVWLVAHHLDLLRAPGPTRRRLRHRAGDLADLEQLRRFDLGGRARAAAVPTPESALATLFAHPDARTVLDPDRGAAAPHTHDATDPDAYPHGKEDDSPAR